ncbi:putative damage-inducible protein DinB (forms a four-helix bundle) [Abditibacterium utsteinense]|uniref:Putative damage-inducible protein DinB (Forms a four-helix bundle) n=1 Tax=Abditibacterium utsteinense TaxID=1960156 RepID=A0A2S8SU64_9BACT|nr:DinB family protein [Abditibacterium utsteinense]PQV64342.1 putative damage-inducible protein DinB (forms a four-helix bundle) [Abditibacterium utsteinense]
MSPFVHNYFSSGVQNNARVIQFLLRDLDENDARWDAKVDAERFSLREIIAHLVDYDTISRERFEHIIREDAPEFSDWDPTEAAAHYASRNPLHQIESLLLSRRELCDWLRGLSEKEWKRTGTRPNVGEFSVEEGAAMMVAHDAYHMEQIAAWLGAIE